MSTVFSFICFTLVISFSIPYTHANGPAIKIPQGKVMGSWAQSYKNRTYSAFYGIPYARPPVGDLRFKEPQPPLPWSGTWLANIFPICSQIFQNQDRENGLYMGDEDCLYLNIFIPSTDPRKIKKRLPVLFNIHGGAFAFGFGTGYAGPAYIMDRDIILVTFNYRLGPLGFLSTYDNVLPGNNGMKDQVAVLKWVNKNIRHFGGDCNQVTLSGFSAGGASVQFHYMSPLSRGLFKNGISFSGTALMPWALQEGPLEKAKDLGAACGCNQSSSTDLITCLRKRPAKQITETSKMFAPYLFNPVAPFAVVIESSNPSGFLIDHPYKLLRNGKVADLPWMTTATTQEGLLPVVSLLNKPNYLPELEDNWNHYCPLMFEFNYTELHVGKKALHCGKIKEFYLNNESISVDTFYKLVKASGDRLIGVGSEVAAKLQAMANGSPVYTYRFNYESEQLPSNVFSISTVTKKLGVAHGDDILVIFSDITQPLAPLTLNDEKMQNILLDFILSFATTGKPALNSHEWLPVAKNINELPYLFVDSPDNIRMKIGNSLANYEFWHSMGLMENENLFDLP